VDRLTFPLNVAAGMEARGIPVGEAKAIVSPVSHEIYNSIVQDLGRAFAGWRLPVFSKRAQAAADHPPMRHFAAMTGMNK
jgi:4-hydroxy-tetrahydrodipicolinate synthase